MNTLKSNKAFLKRILWNTVKRSDIHPFHFGQMQRYQTALKKLTKEIDEAGKAGVTPRPDCVTDRDQIYINDLHRKYASYPKILSSKIKWDFLNMGAFPTLLRNSTIIKNSRNGDNLEDIKARKFHIPLKSIFIGFKNCSPFRLIHIPSHRHNRRKVV